MFVMMNEARLDVGMQALGCASASLQNALNYARERVQGRHLLAGGKDAASGSHYSAPGCAPDAAEHEGLCGRLPEHYLLHRLL